MKYIHLFTIDEHNKFANNFIEFIQLNFNSNDHAYILLSKSSNFTLESNLYKNIFVLQPNIYNMIKINRLFSKSEKIFIHNLLTSKYIYLNFFINSSYLKKTYWCIWGGDLYRYELRAKSIKSVIFDFFRKHIINKVRGLITQLHGDYELAQKWYGARGKYYYSFMYPSNLYKEYDLMKVEKDPEKKYIQVGNSACETNEHIEVFEKLSKYKDEHIEVICPLSYSGKKEYIKQVVESGYKTFGKEKFTPITDFMPFDKYLELLAKVDIAIFNHKRQRGLGNITTLLGLGKKVYLREEITTWQFCKDHALKVYSANGNFDDLFEKMDKKIMQENVQNMKIKFSEKKLVEDWNKIFNGNDYK